MSFINSISSKREEKFAFLFAGPQETSTINFNKDIENMYNTLSAYNNYNPANIVVAYGGTTAPAIAGAVPIASQTDLQTEIESFITAVDAFVVGKLSGPDDFNRSVVIFYFTGIGTNAGSGTLEICRDAGNNIINITPLWLSNELGNLGHGDNYDVHVIMQQDYALMFQTLINGTLNLTNGVNLLLSLVANTGGANGSNYTDQFTRALQFEALLTGDFADQLPSGETNVVSLQISLLQAHNFANTRLGTANTNYQSRISSDALYLGMPEFLIQDSPSPAWWESEDIFLTHPAPVTLLLPDPLDYYAFYPADPTGNYNYVNIIVRNFGTHPVRQFDVGAILYDSGPSGTGTTFKATNQLKDVSTIQNILIPVPLPSQPFPSVLPSFALNCIYNAPTTWQSNEIKFDTQNHRCMRAKAKLSGLADLELLDWTNLTDVNNEGQRNLDVKVLSTRNTVYKIYNAFLTEKLFYLILSKKLDEYARKISWKFSFAEEGKKDFKECKIKVKGNLRYIEFKVSSGAKMNFKVVVTNLQKEEIKGEIRIPFEFITDLQDKGVMRAHKYDKVFPETGSFGGFTVLLRGGHSNVQGVVKLNDGKPASGCKVIVASPDGEFEHVTTTQANGTFVFEQLSYGIYSIKVVKERKISFPKDITVSSRSAKEKVELRIR